MAKADSEGKAGQGEGMVSLMIAIAAVTIVAAGGAAAAAWFETGRQKSETAGAATCGPEERQIAQLGDQVTFVLNLPSIVTNLAGEDAPWLRLDVSVVVPNTTPQKEQLAAQLSQDFLGYVRSLNVSELSGGTNLYLLKEDLTELAKARTSEGSLDVLIRSFLIE